MTTAKQVDFLLAGYRHPTTNRPLAGGKVETFLDGTTTLSALWTDANKGGNAQNPFELDSAGKAEVYGDNIYKFRIYESDDTFVEEITGLEYESVLKTKNEFETIADLRLVFGTVADETAIVLGYDDVGDGGGGPLRYWSQGQPPGTYVDNGGSIIVPTGGDGSAAWLFANFINISPEVFGAAGDGVINDTVAVINAVAVAYAENVSVDWTKNYLTNATIPNLHNIKHTGPGSIKRGANLFYPGVPEGITNTLHVSTTGSDSNDGLSASEPMLTFQHAGNSIYNYTWSPVTWVVKADAGTYSSSSSFPRAFPTPNRVQFKGPDVADGVVPTCIIDSPGGLTVGLLFQNDVLAYVEDIKFTNFSAVSASGIAADARCDLYTRNVHSDNCYQGIKVSSESKVRVQAGILQNGTYGVSCISNVTFTIGYLGTTADITGATGTALLGNTFGFAGAESATGHLDFCYVGSNDTGMFLVEKSRVHLVESVVDSNTNGADIGALSTLFDNPTPPNIWTNNTNKMLVKSNSVEIDTYIDARGAGLQVLRDPLIVTTNSATPLVTTLYTFPAYELSLRGSGFFFKTPLQIVGVSGTKLVEVKFGGVTLLSHTIAASTVAAYIELEFINSTGTGSPDQGISARVFENGISPTINTGNLVIDMSSSLTLTLELSTASGDTIRSRNRIVEVIL